MRIRVDGSLLGAGSSGIRRYLKSILSVWQAERGSLHERALEVSVGGDRRITTPLAEMQRIWSSLVGESFRAAIDSPDVFWGPAHRLPLILPARTKSVVTIHDLCWRIAPDTMRISTRTLDRLLMGLAVRRSCRVIAVSESTARDVIAQWPEAELKLRVIPLAASLPKGDDTPWDGVHVGGSGYFLFVGTWEPRKNLNRLLEAYALAGRDNPEWPDLVICGSRGWGGVNPQEISEKLAVQTKVHVVADVSDQILATLYRHAICLVMPSLYEGFGLPLVEAMAQGCPVLTSNRASMPEVAADAGILVDPECPGSIANGLLKMATDTEFREHLASRAVLIASNFSWEKTAESTWQVLLEAGHEN
jgi:glycosyltransferase involved in cell wall biosynthesis